MGRGLPHAINGEQEWIISGILVTLFMHWYEVQVTKVDGAEGHALEPKALNTLEPADLPSFSIPPGKLLKMHLRL